MKIIICIGFVGNVCRRRAVHAAQLSYDGKLESLARAKPSGK
jgi:hypothetical protein